ncbi:MAG: MFS transporter [Chloroflexi bacterium]|nr:MFS transporter [Chloroflexota bacterium]
MMATGQQIARRRLRRPFYGWWVVSVSFVNNMVHAGAGVTGYGLFLIPMGVELGWSRAAMGAAMTVRTVAGALAGPFAGALADHPQGARLLLVVGGLVGGASLLFLSASTELWQLYLAYGVLWGLGIAIGSELVGSTVVAKWFIKKRSRALAVSTLGLSTGGSAIIPVAHVLIEQVGWRTTWAILGVLTWVLLVPLAAIVVRRQPEDVGLHPDGDAEAVPAEATTAKGEVCWTLRSAIRTRTFWSLAAAMTLARIPIQGVLVHFYPYLRDTGFSSVLASGVFTVYTLSLALAKPLWGFGMERWNVRWAIVGQFVGCGTLILALLATASSPAGIVGFVLLYPLSVGGWAVAEVMLWTTYYGRGFLGSLRGAVYPAMVICTGLGPLLGGLLRDATGSYTSMWVLFAGAWLGSGVLLALAPRPAKPSS